MLLLWSGAALARGPSADKVLKYVDKGDFSKAWSYCEAAVADGGIDAGAPTEACATAALGLLRAQNTTVSADNLDTFVQRWGLTSAGKEARQLAARTRLSAAGTRIVALADVVARYPDSEAAAEAMKTAWTQTELIHTAGGWRAFADQFPTSPRRSEAVELAQGLAFQEAEEYNTVSAWKHFIDTWPLHQRRSEAEERLTALEYAAARAAGPEAQAAYEAAHPNAVPTTAAVEVILPDIQVYVPDDSGNPVEVSNRSVNLPSAQRRIWVRAKSGAKLSLGLDGPGGTRTPEMALPTILRDAGLSIDDVPTKFTNAVTTMPDGTLAVTLPAEMCNPGGAEAWIIAIESGGERRNVTLVPAESCAEMAEQLKPKARKR